MATHTAKPVAVEAFQMTYERRNKRDEWPEWLRQDWDANVVGYYAGGRMLRGMKTFYWGDWIIQGDAGMLRLCAQEQFHVTYELAKGTN